MKRPRFCILIACGTGWDTFPTITYCGKDIEQARTAQMSGDKLIELGTADSVIQALAAFVPDKLPTLRERMRALILDGRKVSAIRLCRMETALGLREAKDAVDQMVQEMKEIL